MVTPRTRARARRLCALQMHHTDAEPRLLEHSAVPRLVESGLFDDVVLCVADVPENDALVPFAEAWGIPLVRGAERDVARRILDAARERGAESIARALVWWFFVDTDLVARQLQLLEAGDADWVDLPRDFDQRFGVDAFRPRLLERVGAAFDADATLRERYGLNPWSFVEAHPDGFEVRTCTDVPRLDREAFECVRATMRTLWPERWDGAGTPLYPYARACELLRDAAPARPRALDVACGLGAGTARLAEVADATGVDLDGGAVARCRERYGDAATFVEGDALALDLPAGAFDVVTSVHTLEHLEDERGFVAAARRWLKPGGALVLEVPFLARGPFYAVETPLSPGHVREYDAASLRALVADGFELVETRGVARGAYVPLERARSAGLVVARRAA